MKRYIFVLSVASALLAACGGKTPKTQEAPQKFEFTVKAVGNTMMDMDYDTKEIKVTAGSDIKVKLINTGTDASMLHNIVFVKSGSEKEVAMQGIELKDKNYFNPENPNVIAGSTVTQPGGSVDLQFTAPAAGTYSYICTYPGHWQKMQGKLIVE
jgi:azurin